MTWITVNHGHIFVFINLTYRLKDALQVPDIIKTYNRMSRWRRSPVHLLEEIFVSVQVC